MRPRWITADNPGPFTLDGTRTFFVGDRSVALVDPGPDDPAHVEALAAEASKADHVTILLTHGHPDHAGATETLAERIGAEVRGSGHPRARPLAPGEPVRTDAGEIFPVDTPGHARPHTAFHWPAADALFAGDFVLGRGDTTWVGEYEGCVADYLASLERIRALDCSVIYPAHGPPIDDVEACLDRYEAHRMDRIAQVREVLARRPDTDVEGVLEAVYGDRLPGAVVEAVRMSTKALLDFVRQHPA